MSKPIVKQRKKRPEKVESYTKNYSILLFFGFTIILLPLIYLKQTLDPVLMPQLFAAGLFLFLFWIYYHVFFRRNSFGIVSFKPVIIWLAIGYLLTIIISAFFAINTKESLFDISKTLVFIGMIFLSLDLLKESIQSLKTISIFFLISVSIALIIGFQQYMKDVFPDPNRLLDDGRSVIYLVDGLMAHKNLYSSSLFMSLPLLIFGFFQSTKTMRFIFGLVISLTFFMIFLLSTRAVWLGVFVAAGLTGILMVLFAKQFGISPRIRKGILISMAALMVSGLILVVSIDSTENYSPVERLKSIVSPKDVNNIFRLQVWEITMDIIKKNPFVGVGAGNWKLIAPNFYHNFNFTVKQLNWISPHNDLLWVWAEKGLLGFAFFIGVFAVTLYYLLTVLKRTSNSSYRLLALLLIGGFAGYLVISFFDFPLDRIVHQVWLAIWIAISTILYLQLTPHQQTGKFSFYWTIPISVLLIFPFIYGFSASKLEIYVEKARKAQFRNDWTGMLEMAKKIPTTFRNLDAEAMPVYYYQGLAYEKAGQFEKAKTNYLLALHDHPTKVQVLNNLGLMYFNLKQYEEAKQYFERALEILPDFFETLVNLSATFIILEDYEKSLEYLNKIPKNLWDDRFYKRAEYLEQKIRQKSSQK